MTLILDCYRQITKKLDRKSNSIIATDGLIFTGVQLQDSDGFFMGDIQMFLIADTPDEAFFICTKYSKDCAGSNVEKKKIHATGSSLESSEQISSANNDKSSRESLARPIQIIQKLSTDTNDNFQLNSNQSTLINSIRSETSLASDADNIELNIDQSFFSKINETPSSLTKENRTSSGSISKSHKTTKSKKNHNRANRRSSGGADIYDYLDYTSDELNENENNDTEIETIGKTIYTIH